MQLLHFIAAWLFPGTACSAAKLATKAMTVKSSSEPDNASSLAFSVKPADDSGSSISSSSSSSSSSSDDHPRFFASRQQQQQSPSASPLCFGAGGAAGRLLRGSRAARARSPTKQEHAAAASMAPLAPTKGDVVGRYLRKISRRLRKARAAAASKGSSPPSHGGGGGDDTARERAEAVARAISYCKDTLRRGAAPPPPSPSLDDLLHGRQNEIVAGAAAHCVGSEDSKTPPPPPRRGIECSTPPQPHRAGAGLAKMQATAKQGKDSTRSASPNRDGWIAASGIVHGEELPRHGHKAIMDKRRRESATTMAEPAVSSSPAGDLAADEMGMPGSFDEMEFLKIFDGDGEMIGHHFITVQT